MKILIVNSFYSPYNIGGAEKSVQHLAELLVKSGHDVYVISTARNNEQRNINGVEVIYLRSRNIYWFYNVKKRTFLLKGIFHLIDAFNPFYFFPLTKAIRAANPDVIHTNNLMGISVIIWKIASILKIPVIHTLRDYYLLCIKSTMYKKSANCTNRCIECKILSWPRRKYSKTVTFVSGISNFVLEKHKQFGYFSKVPNRLIYNSFHLPRNYKIRNNHNKRIIFGTVGQIVRTKGIELLIETFKNLPECQLFIYGKIIEKDLELAMSEIDNVLYKGYENPTNIYNTIHVLIIPSLWNEPFGRVIVEAFSHAIPVIGSNRGGIPELIINGENGFIFDPNDKASLREIISSLANNPSRINALSKNARISASKFNEDDLINDYEEVYKRIIVLKE